MAGALFPGALTYGTHEIISSAFDAFADYDLGEEGWHTRQGDYQILVGSSSRGIRLYGSVKQAKTVLLGD